MSATSNTGGSSAALFRSASSSSLSNSRQSSSQGYRVLSACEFANTQSMIASLETAIEACQDPQKRRDLRFQRRDFQVLILRSCYSSKSKALSEKSRQADQLSKENDDLVQSRARLVDRVANLRQKLRGANARTASAEMAQGQAVVQAARLNTDLTETKRKLEESSAQNNQLESNYDDLLKQQHATAAELSGYKRRLRDSEDKHGSLITTYEQLVEEHDSLVAEFQANDRDWSQRQQVLLGEKAELEARLTKTKAALDEKADDLASAQRSLGDVKRRKKASDEKAKAAETKANVAATTLAKIRDLTNAVDDNAN